MAAVKKFDAVSRSTWARLKSAGRSPIGAKPFAAERMDQNPLLVGRARGVDPDMAPMRLATTPVPETPPTNEALEGVFITLRIALDLSQILGDPDRVGKVLAEAVRIASGAGDVVGLTIDADGLHVEVNPGDTTMAALTRKRRAMQARLESLLASLAA